MTASARIAFLPHITALLHYATRIESRALFAPGKGLVSAPLATGQALRFRSLAPIRPHVGADDPAPGADHAGAKAGTGTASLNASTFITASWWHSSQVTDSERTPFSRMLASVIGGPR
jgi:hypothetical protein